MKEFKLKLKQELLKSPFIDLLKPDLRPNDDIAFIYISGSLGVNLFEKTSDIDLHVATINTTAFETSITGLFEKHSMHWWYLRADNYFNQCRLGEKYNLILIGQYFLDLADENIIYINPKYKELFNLIQKNQDIISKIGLYHHYEAMRFENKLWLTAENKSLPKKYSLYLDYYYKANNIERNNALVVKMKHDPFNLTEEEKEECIDGIAWTFNYLENNDYNYIKDCLILKSEYDEILKTLD